MTVVTIPAKLRANYGFDAPGIMIGLVSGGALAVMAGVSIALVGLLPLFLGIVMVGYGLVGKHRMRDHMLARIAWRGDEQVLDIGTGSGLLLVGAAKRLGAKGHVTGIDIWRREDLSDNSIDRLNANISIEDVGDRTTARDADARDLPFADAAFDIVLSLYCIHNIDEREDRDRALKEIARVLKPGGQVLIGEWFPTHDYARELGKLGLVVGGSRSLFNVALGPMWLVDAVKPAAAG